MILNAKGEPYRRLTLMDSVLMTLPPSKEMLSITEKLQERNNLAYSKTLERLVNPPMMLPLQEKSPILDQYGRPIWRDIWECADVKRAR